MQHSFPSRPILSLVPRMEFAATDDVPQDGRRALATVAMKALANGLQQLAGTTEATNQPERIRALTAHCVENLGTFMQAIGEQIAEAAEAQQAFMATVYDAPRPVAEPAPEFLHDAEGRN